MLSLTRREGETVIIGDDIKITILKIKGSADPQIKIGIEAPGDIAVHRQKVPEKSDLKPAS